MVGSPPVTGKGLQPRLFPTHIGLTQLEFISPPDKGDLGGLKIKNLPPCAKFA